MDAILKSRMTIHDVASYLTRFDAPPTAMALKEEDETPGVESLFEIPEPLAPEPAAPAPEPTPGREEIYAECETKFQAALAAEREAFENRLNQERDNWATQEAAALSEKLTRALDNAVENLRGDIARILSPFVSKEISLRMLDDVTAALRAGVANEAAPAIRVHARKDLLQKIECALAPEKIALTLVESDDVEIHATFGSTTVETCLSEWMTRLPRE